MSSKVQALFESLKDPVSIEDLGYLIDRIRDVFDVAHVAYHAFSLGQSYTAYSNGGGSLSGDFGLWRREGSSVAALSYGVEWGKRYEEQEYWRIDPVVDSAIGSFLPIDWKKADWSSKRRRQFMREAIDIGVGTQGYSIPIRGPDGQFALFTINKNATDQEWARYIDEYKSDFLVVAHFFHQKVLEIERVFGPAPTPQLSSREREALTYLSTGKSRSQTSYEMKISENTLRIYLDSARHKLGALNITHAVAVGIQKGILNI
jgi:DNA-binding CsgD family transcriptional regulator